MICHETVTLVPRAMSSPTELEDALLRLARPGMTATQLFSQVRALYPDASKKETTHAALAAMLRVSGNDVERALALQDFAIKGRGGDE